MNEQNALLVNSLIMLNREVKQLLAESYAFNLELGESAISFLKELAAPCMEHATQSQFAARLGVSESSLCTLIEKLRRDGIVVRERLTTDRRKTKISFSELGTKIFDQIVLTELRIESLLIHRLNENAQLEHVHNALSVILKATQACEYEIREERRAA